jgi:hypothetical protein
MVSVLHNKLTCQSHPEQTRQITSCVGALFGPSPWTRWDAYRGYLYTNSWEYLDLRSRTLESARGTESVHLTNCYYDDQLKKTDMWGAFNKFRSSLRGCDPVQGVNTCTRTTLQWILKTRCIRWWSDQLLKMDPMEQIFLVPEPFILLYLVRISIGLSVILAKGSTYFPQFLQFNVPRPLLSSSLHIRHHSHPPVSFNAMKHLQFTQHF